jgi:hypothetical protein
LIVSVLELACTGQVYLPTISFVVGIPEMRASAIAYLVMYNLVFILPLLVGACAGRVRGQRPALSRVVRQERCAHQANHGGVVPGCWARC